MAGAAAVAATRSRSLRRSPSAFFYNASKPWPSFYASLPLVPSTAGSFSFSPSASEVEPPTEPVPWFQKVKGFWGGPKARQTATGSRAVASSDLFNLESFADELKKARAFGKLTQFGRGLPCGGEVIAARSLQKQGYILRKLATYSSDGRGDPQLHAKHPGEAGKSPDDKPVKRKKLSKKERFGKYDEEFDDEMAQVPIDETIEHLYDARPIFEEWMGHPTFYDMISADAYPKKGVPNDEPPGEGPILRWQTRVVLSPGGEAFHPKNRKVKVSVYVKELELSPLQRERLLFMVGKRYNPNKDELTIISERYDQREENRKDVLRTLLSLIEEAKKEDENVGTVISA